MRFAFTLLITGWIAATATCQEATVPATVFWDGAFMASIRSSPSKHDTFRSEFKRLRKAARKAREREPISIVDKLETPPSGDKHDYLSYSRYWWPDPDSADGLPYIRKDGVVNRELVNRGDRNSLGGIVDDVVHLALANYFLEDEASGKHARRLIRVWFLEKSTRMNPNLNYAQAVPGRAAGRGVGIIDARGFIWMLDAVELMRSTGALGHEEIVGLKQWYSEFLHWLSSSPLADEEREKSNNHGSWFAALAARIALFVDQADRAKEIAIDVRDHRIKSQIDSQGRQPEELERTQAMHYSFFNLAALTIVARVGDQVGVDLWLSKLKSAADFLAPYTCGDEKSPYKQIKKLKISHVEQASLRMIAKQLQSESAAKMAATIPVSDDDEAFTVLQFPIQVAR